MMIGGKFLVEFSLIIHPMLETHASTSSTAPAVITGNVYLNFRISSKLKSDANVLVAKSTRYNSLTKTDIDFKYHIFIMSNFSAICSFSFFFFSSERLFTYITYNCLVVTGVIYLVGQGLIFPFFTVNDMVGVNMP